MEMHYNITIGVPIIMITQELTHKDEDYKISPEFLEITNVYLQTLDLKQTALLVGCDEQVVINALNKKEVRRFVDNVFLNQGYMNRHKLQETMSSLIEKKLEEMEEAGVGSSKDIVELLQVMHKMRMDELKMMMEREKVAGPATQTNIQVNNQFGDNYASLLRKLTT